MEQRATRAIDGEAVWVTQSCNHVLVSREPAVSEVSEFLARGKVNFDGKMWQKKLYNRSSRVEACMDTQMRVLV